MKKSSFVLILGETNAGKSTLLNKIIGDKVAIVSHKVQTTRHKILGIYTQNHNQLVFIDTPGIFNPQRDFDKNMVDISYSAIEEADSIIFLLDANKGLTKLSSSIIEKLPENKKNIFVINKVDLIAKDKLLDLVNQIKDYNKFSDFFYISAKTGLGVDNLVSYLIKNSKEDVWYFDEDQTSDQSLSKIATEITREHIYEFLHQELPYNMAVEHLSWEEDDVKITIHQNVYAINDNHKSMLIGKNASKIKQIRISSQKQMEKLFGKRVSLFLMVKVSDKWLYNKTD